MYPLITEIQYTSIKPGQDIRILNWKEFSFLERVKDTQVINFAPQTIGGNHRHPRTEWYIAFGELILYWLDKSGKRHRRHLNPKGKLLLVEIPPYLPHAVRNLSADFPGFLLELADAPQTGVEKLNII
ncbi:MAG: hypothetical protein UV68_C0007G0014 [Candidatus Collierbacteria bacterium GW2011_GWC2_43_12]|uniref:Sugar 3,4-ketoisomerase QdtA cupin domain-containing protein n=2 Tax=Candidatus Collieribacteriota TaxID=1752725 RepID=A0A0G1DA95_9BACT|nr:MAG: hypothetical protein UV68_C0007G0014 [Candidatus Collierbacteria bacterium GW2011_GWC2_43_12]KKT83116.1 MAG: hypothetical protein UW80_C0021G0006 [Microgenomates group bacterium GW2011_GWC1_44_9]